MIDRTIDMEKETEKSRKKEWCQTDRMTNRMIDRTTRQ